MTLKSALQDVRETTLAAVSGLLGKLSYLASLRRVHGGYEHWGIARVYGPEAAKRALKTAHGEVLALVLRAPLASLTEDLEATSGSKGLPPQECIEDMRGRFDDLVLGEGKDLPKTAHLNSVLTALSFLAESQERATPSAS